MRLSPTPYVEEWDTYMQRYCSGHSPDDVLAFQNLWDEDNRYYTNAELYDLFDPRNPSLQYVYDTFEWAHCQKIGYKMQNS